MNPPGCPHRNQRPLEFALVAKEGKKTPPGFTRRAPATLPFSADRIDYCPQLLHALPLHLLTPFHCHLQSPLFTKSRGTAASIRAESIATDGDNMAAFSASNKKDLNLIPPSARPRGRREGCFMTPWPMPKPGTGKNSREVLRQARGS